MPILEGVYAAAITPRRLGMQDINLGVMWELIDFLCEKKIQGIVLLGSTGEFVHYSPSERMRMMGLAPKRSRVPVVMNVSHSTLDGAVEMAQAAAASGAVGVLLMPPYFYRYSDDAILAFYRAFAEEADLRIPVMLYNIPQFGNAVSCRVLEQLVREGIVHGIKDSSGDWETLTMLAALRAGQSFTLMAGHDSLFARAKREAGVSGAISGVASALPELLLSLDRAVASGRQPVAETLERRLNEFIAWIDNLPVPVGIKEAAGLRGLKVGPHATVFAGAPERTICEFREWFQGWLPDVLTECKNA